MVDQATMNASNGTGGLGEPKSGRVAPIGRASATPETTASAGQVAGNVADFGENMLNMAELQVQMAAIELRQNVEAIRIVAGVGLAGTVMALAALPIALAGIAELLVTTLGLSRGTAFLFVGFTTLCLGLLCVMIAGLWIRRKRLGFPLSAEELARNLNWVRTVLRLSGRHRVHRG
jgi:hypothetical protein